jgi:hypothetical protein
MNLIKAFITVVSSILFLILLSFILSWPVYMLWNGCLVDAVQGVKEVTWLQAWGLSILAGFLFKQTDRVKE